MSLIRNNPWIDDIQFHDMMMIHIVAINNPHKNLVFVSYTRHTTFSVKDFFSSFFFLKESIFCVFSFGKEFVCLSFFLLKKKNILLSFFWFFFFFIFFISYFFFIFFF